MDPAESDRRFRMLAENAPVMLWRTGKDTFCDWLNRTWLAFTGRTLEDEVGEGWMRGVHPDDVGRLLEVSLPAFRAREPFRVEFRLLRHDGQFRWLLTSGVPAFDTSGAFEGYIGSSTDISEIKMVQAERELRLRERAELIGEIRRTAARQRIMLREIMASITEDRLVLCESAADLPRSLEDCGTEPVLLTSEKVRDLRHRVMKAADLTGLAQERAFDLVMAAGEAAINAVVHAGGGTGRVCWGEKVQVWISDRGGGIADDALHQATLRRGFSSAGTLGHGFHMILKTADRTFLLTGPTGTTVVLEQHPQPPEPVWLREFSAPSH